MNIMKAISEDDKMVNSCCLVSSINKLFNIPIKNAKGIKLHKKSEIITFDNILVRNFLFNKNFVKNLYEKAFLNFFISKIGNTKIFIKICDNQNNKIRI